MIIRLAAIGKTTTRYLEEGIAEYVGRLQHYLRFEYIEIPDVKISKGMNDLQVKQKEGVELLKLAEPGAHVILLDEHGKTFSSVRFAEHLQKRFNSGGKSITFMIGGPYGFSEDVYRRANEKIALSTMTFSHQMVRLIAAEQIYRAMTILRNEPYHHE